MVESKPPAEMPQRSSGPSSVIRRPGRWRRAAGLVALAFSVAVLVTCFLLWPRDTPRATQPPQESGAVSPSPQSGAARVQAAATDALDSLTATTNDQSEGLATLPGIESWRLDRPLSEAMSKVDATEDGWPIEVFNDQATKRLHDLAKLLSAPHDLESLQLEDLITSDFACGPLRPDLLERVFTDQALTVWRPSSGSEEGARLTYRGADGLIAAIQSLAAPLADAYEIKVRLKIYRVELTERSAHTAVSYEARGRYGQSVVQQNATWQCRWTAPRDGNSPRIESIRLEDYEEIVPRQETGVLFADCTQAVLGNNASFGQQLVYGIDHWRRVLETSFDPDLSGFQGISVGDVNGDDLEDVYLCQQGGLPNRLFVQRPDGTLDDVSSAAGVDYLELTSSALLIDLDNDGDQDLVLATLTAVVPFANDGTGKFSRRGQINLAAAPQSLAAIDYDGDSRLDLYVCGYSAGAQVWNADTGLGAPVPYYDANNGGRNVLLRNTGDFGFQDVTSQVGLNVNNSRFSFAATWEDYDNDGDPDLYVANDFGRNNLFRNDKGHFVDVAREAGVEDMATGMSASWGDYNNDGWMDIYVSNMFSSAGNRIAYQRQFLPVAVDATRSRVQRFARGNSLFRNNGDGTFLDVSESAAVTRGRWAWASKFVDLNNDGWEDLVVANGFITHHDRGDL